VRESNVRRGAIALVGALLALAAVNSSIAQAAVASPTDNSNPAGLVESVARAILTAIDAHREEIPEGLRQTRSTSQPAANAAF
jgi:hypothetical protein